MGSVPLCPSRWGQEGVLTPPAGSGSCLRHCWCQTGNSSFPFGSGLTEVTSQQKQLHSQGQTLPSSAGPLCGTPESPEEPRLLTLRASPAPRHPPAVQGPCASLSPCSEGITGLCCPTLTDHRAVEKPLGSTSKALPEISSGCRWRGFPCPKAQPVPVTPFLPGSSAFCHFSPLPLQE